MSCISSCAPATRIPTPHHPRTRSFSLFAGSGLTALPPLLRSLLLPPICRPTVPTHRNLPISHPFNPRQRRPCSSTVRTNNSNSTTTNPRPLPTRPAHRDCRTSRAPRATTPRPSAAASRPAQATRFPPRRSSTRALETAAGIPVTCRPSQTYRLHIRFSHREGKGSTPARRTRLLQCHIHKRTRRRRITRGSHIHSPNKLLLINHRRRSHCSNRRRRTSNYTNNFTSNPRPATTR